jgi:hypothetical protein
VGVVLALATPVPARAAAFDVFEARAEAGGIHDSVAVPAYFETFLPYSLDEASNGSAHGYHSTFYGGFFLTAAAEQYGAPNPPGTTETLYPQGPTTANASTIPFPGAEMGASHGTSGAFGSEGAATLGAGAFGPAGSIGFGQTDTSVTVGSAVRSRARVAMHNLQLGPLSIGAVNVSAEAVSGGTRGSGKVSKSLTFTDLSVGGMPIGVTEIGTAGPVDAALAQAGLTITRLPDTRSIAADGTNSRVEVGGVKVTFSQPAQEFTVTWTLGRVSAAARALPSLPAIETAAPRLALPGLGTELIEPPRSSVDGITARAPATSTGLQPAAGLGPADELRRVRRTRSAGAMDLTTLAALVALVAIFSSLARRAFRAVASP